MFEQNLYENYSEEEHSIIDHCVFIPCLAFCNVQKCKIHKNLNLVEKNLDFHNNW